jgi:hypothetical protein
VAGWEYKSRTPEIAESRDARQGELMPQKRERKELQASATDTKTRTCVYIETLEG